MRILVVEDDPVISKILTSILIKRSYEVVAASSGAIAIELLNKGESFDLIISDLVMPGIDGFQLLQYVKANARFSRIPVLMASSMDDKDSIIRCIALGAKDYILKPVDKNTLLTKVENVLDKWAKAILLVDDDNLILDVLSKILGREGFKTLRALSGTQALETIVANNVWMVISDIEMPGMNGMDLLVRVKEYDDHIPVLMITGKGAMYNRHQVIDAGADGYITKPFRNIEVIDCVSLVYRKVFAISAPARSTVTR